MKDRLPQISIKIDTSPDEFLRRIEELARQIGEYMVESEHEPAGSGKLGILRLKPILLTQHRELVVSLSVEQKSPDRVNVEVQAARWHPDPPTYRAYVTAARDIIKPLLHQYNLKHHTARKLQVQSREATEPHLPDMAGRLFDRFINLAHKSALRSRDWQRFYHFIWHCAVHNVHINREDVHRLLVNAGFTIEYSANLADIFEHGWALVKRGWQEEAEERG